MGRRGPTYFFIDLIEKYIGTRCWFTVAAFTALVGGTLSFWMNDWIVTAIVGVPAISALAICYKRRARERAIEPGEVVGVGYVEGTGEVIPYFWMRWTSQAVHKVRRVLGRK